MLCACMGMETVSVTREGTEAWLRGSVASGPTVERCVQRLAFTLSCDIVIFRGRRQKKKVTVAGVALGERSALY